MCPEQPWAASPLFAIHLSVLSLLFGFLVTVITVRHAAVPRRKIYLKDAQEPLRENGFLDWAVEGDNVTPSPLSSEAHEVGKGISGSDDRLDSPSVSTLGIPFPPLHIPLRLFSFHFVFFSLCIFTFLVIAILCEGIRYNVYVDDHAHFV